MFSRRRATILTAHSISAISRLKSPRRGDPRAFPLGKIVALVRSVSFVANRRSTAAEWATDLQDDPQRPGESPNAAGQSSDVSVGAGRFPGASYGRDCNQSSNGRSMPNDVCSQGNVFFERNPSAAPMQQMGVGVQNLNGGPTFAGNYYGDQVSYDSGWNQNRPNGWNAERPVDYRHVGSDAYSQGYDQVRHDGEGLGMGNTFQQSHQASWGQIDQQRMGEIPPENPTQFSNRHGGRLEGFQRGFSENGVVGAVVHQQTRQVPPSVMEYQHGVNASHVNRTNELQQRTGRFSGTGSHNEYLREVQQWPQAPTYQERPNWFTPEKQIDFQHSMGAYRNENNFGQQNLTPSQSEPFGSYVTNGHEGRNAVADNEENTNCVATVDELDDICKEGDVEKAVEVLGLLEKQGTPVDLPRYFRLLQLCGDPRCVEEARIVHDHLLRTYKNVEVEVYNKMLEMYSKCGSMDDARKLFEAMPEKDLASWGIMIIGMANNGMGEEAIDLFSEFKQMGLKPDRHIFTTVFHACGVMGAVDEGMLHFESMSKDFSIDPDMEHYSSIVGMLGAAGYLEEAMEFIESMPVIPSVDVWETLMNFCRVNGNVELGDRCAEIVESMDASRLTKESKVGLVPVKASDQLKKEKKKLELLAARTKVHEYRCGDKSHPEKDRIYGLIWSLAPIMKEAGYVPDTRFVLHDVDPESKEDALLYHSERLATAHGLLTSHARSPIRVIKNLRICGDCHNAMKILSKVVGRQLIMRDAKRFHHFENGVCSCRDYW